jgi:aspartyl-tRNA(Asn)/glutamyl-tRNA(Gln) amidotransferase subunit C
MILGGFSQFSTRLPWRSHASRSRALPLTPSEIPVYQESLSRILDFIGALERADTANVTPMAHPLPGLTQRLRPDVVTESDGHELYQLNAPLTAAGLYLVPKVIE